ncbi:metal-dependent hydrolase [Telmatospirillum sp. J64-1]|uniref:metal-dependent hydrolase n=1 Tax=Telmatospirillum sp. J64-1 TaxID=2502183 RepID=UPI00115D5203|nr:metal-dependent hydrolase [Telmatospirillum sp. J64-1]
MDTVTQMLLGATVAQAGFRRKLGRGAMVAGAAIALVPDLDVVAGWVGDTFTTWQHHRGITHSIFFGPVVGPLFGWLAWRIHRWRTNDRPDVMAGETLRAWIWLAVLALLTHPIIDLFTSYGTQLLTPFSTHRFAVDAMSIIDPVYSLILILALLVGAFARNRPRLAQDVAGGALIVITAYTLMGWAINDHVKHVARGQVTPAAQIEAYPLLFQPYYRRVVASTEQETLVGFYSVLNPRPITWQSFPRSEDPRIDRVAAQPEAQLFDWFSLYRLHWRVIEEADGRARVEALDTRYGLPQNGSELGFWGIRAMVGPDGELAGPVETFSLPRDGSRNALVQFWREMVGE